MPRAKLSTPLTEIDFNALDLVAKGKYWAAPVISLIRLFAYGYVSERSMVFSMSELGMYRLTLGPAPTAASVEAAVRLYEMTRTPGLASSSDHQFKSLKHHLPAYSSVNQAGVDMAMAG